MNLAADFRVISLPFTCKNKMRLKDWKRRVNKVQTQGGWANHLSSGYWKEQFLLYFVHCFNKTSPQNWFVSGLPNAWLPDAVREMMNVDWRERAAEILPTVGIPWQSVCYMMPAAHSTNQKHASDCHGSDCSCNHFLECYFPPFFVCFFLRWRHWNNITERCIEKRIKWFSLSPRG